MTKDPVDYGLLHNKPCRKQSGEGGDGGGPAPALFDLFYEEFLCGVMADKGLSEKVFTEFVALQSDAERVEYLLTSSPTIRDFELKTKLGTKNLEQSVKLREEGNRFFQVHTVH